jgi:hypothetical protein
MSRVSARVMVWVVLAMLAVGGLGCDDEGGTQQVPSCLEGQVFDESIQACAYPPGDFGDEDVDSSPDSSQFDDTNTAPPDTTPPDTTPPDMGIDPSCDEDNDKVLSIACGGTDCDDNNPRRSPNVIEACDAIDNDCDEQVNEFLDCGFYAHTARELFFIDPFSLSLSKIADLPRFGGLDLTDIDTHPDGTLYGVTQEGLFVYVASANRWFPVDTFDTRIDNANGLAFDGLGIGFITAAGRVYSYDVPANASGVVGDMGGDFYSSGDCVVNKSNTLFMTSRRVQGNDVLVQIDRQTAQATEIGPTGFGRIYGLTFAYGTLYGLTGAGQLLEIDFNTGAATLLHTFDGQGWYGAASAPGR